MNERSASILRTARYNQQVEADVMKHLEHARDLRDVLWRDFFANLDMGYEDTDRLRAKMFAWEKQDSLVGQLEVKAGIYNQHRTWVANYDRLVEVGYKE